MPAANGDPVTTSRQDFWKFLVGQTLSSFGTAFTRFALPLLVYKLTGSALSLALTTTFTFLPVILLGLVIGVWLDRTHRKRVMIGADLGRAAIIAGLALLSGLHLLSIGLIYAVAVLSSVLAMCFETGQFAAVACLVELEDLVQANGRLQASYAIATVTGSALGGAALAVVTLPVLLVIDAASFLVSAASLALIIRSFDAPHEQQGPTRSHPLTDLREGLAFIWGQPVLRSVIALFAVINAVAPTLSAQLVLFAKRDLRSDDVRIGFLYAAGSGGVVLLSLLAGRLHRRFPYGVLILGTWMTIGALTVVLALTRRYAVAAPLWAAISGLTALGDIASGSLTQASTPAALLGRVMSAVRVVAWSTIPLGTAVGGIVIERTKQVAPVYATIGSLLIAIACAFSFTPLLRTGKPDAS